MLSASKSAFTPALALQIAVPRPRAKPKAEGSARLAGDPLHLLADDVEGAARQEVAEGVEVALDSARIGEEAIEGHERGDRGEDRQARIEGHARRDREHPVVAEAFVHAPEDVLPS